MLGYAESEHLRLTDREIIFEEFQPMSSQSINVTDGRTDRRHAISRPRLHCSASRGKNAIPRHIAILQQTFTISLHYI